jgi:hypothetical protein
VVVVLGGCFATSTLVRMDIAVVVVDLVVPSGWMFCHLSRFGRMLCRRGSSSPMADALPMGFLALRQRLCNHSDVAISFCRFSCNGGVGSFGLWVECVVLLVLLVVVRVVVVCAFLSVSLFLVLCALVLVKLCLAVLNLCL